VTDHPGPVARIALWVKPGSRTDALAWDAWRSRWVVSCRAPASGGRANRAVAILMADWVGLPHASVQWVKSGASHAKVLSMAGITDYEAARRLQSRLMSDPLEAARP
jgi:uncharacterized protein YggU (UPF0235/DUF167 family)